MTAAAGSPRPVTRGESPPVGLDWLNFTVSDDVVSFDDLVRGLLDVCPNLGGFIPAGRGVHGYSDRYDSRVGSAIVATGGNRSHLVQLAGGSFSAETHLPTLREFVSHHHARITRVDLCCDFLDGALGVDDAVNLYRAGAFTVGGRPPSVSQAGNWLTADDKGRTLYVGRGANGKMLRVYEKGKQVGAPDSPWVRWEVQLRAVDRGIPHDVITDPATYFAGAYPDALSWAAPGSRIKTLAAIDGIVLDALCDHARRAYGRLVDVMLARDCSAEDVVARLRRPGVPSRLGAPDAHFDGVATDGGIDVEVRA